MHHRSTAHLSALFATLLAVGTLGGCNGQSSGQPAAPAEPAPTAPGPVSGDEPLPPNHPTLEGMAAPHPAMPTDVPEHQHPRSSDLPVVMPPSVTQKWAAVRLAVTPASAAEQELRITIGGTAPVAGSDVTLTVTALLPSYMSDSAGITSASDELKNPAVRIEARQGQTLLAAGWVFMHFPDFDTFDSEQLQLRLLSAEARTATPAK